jgi:transcriptional regulator with XRE-family HTH domain
MRSEQIRQLRRHLGLTQQQFADLLGVSFVTLNRWENGQTRPSALGQEKLRQAAAGLAADRVTASAPSTATPANVPVPERLDFLGDAEALRVLVEGERLSYGHLFNPVFATEVSRIDPLPHQRIAVYDRMLPQPRLRFLLADDAGAGKTIMTGLYIRECLTRRTLRRVLVVAPAGLVGNWQRELRNLFRLQLRIVGSAEAKDRNPFVGDDSDLVVTSIDSLRSPRLFTALCDPAVPPYDLVVFDEAHKLACHRDPDGTVRPTERYRLAEAIAGVRDLPDAYRLPWSAHHLLLLTATPHMGKPYPYYALWRLLEPEQFSTQTAFERLPANARARFFIRRVKEEMVDLHGTPLYPARLCDTLSFDLGRGPVSEQTLYDRTTSYIRNYYNLARVLNRQAARFAVMIFQRRLASSTWALLCSLRKRLAKLDTLIELIRSNSIPDDEWRARQDRLNQQVAKGKLADLLADQTADEEATVHGHEAHEEHEDEALGAFVATSLAELLAEREEVRALLGLAEAVHAQGHDAKFERLRELLADPAYRDEKVILYTEHRDTLDFLKRGLEGLGYTGQIACVHGGMGFAQRDAEVERFRAPHRQGGEGARFFVATDAAAEGINLQFCWILVNYDVPWNPARLEQRMGRIHRYGQPRERVAIINLIAGATREGRVVKTLLDKLEEIRRQLGSDKVFDVIGRMFEEVSLADYVRRAVESDAQADREAMALAGSLTADQIRALAERDERIYGRGGDLAADLPRLREALAIEELRRLLPGYVRRYLERAAPLIGVDLVGDPEAGFILRPRRPGVLERLLPVLDTYPRAARARFSVYPHLDADEAIYLHPGEPVFERLAALAAEQARPAGRRGAIFTDPGATAPYLFHVARLTVVRVADPGVPGLGRAEIVEQRLVGLKQLGDNRCEEAPVEQLLLLKAGHKTIPASVVFLAHGDTWRLAAAEHLETEVLAHLAMLQRLAGEQRCAQAEQELGIAYDCLKLELAKTYREYTKKARDGDRKAVAEAERIRAEEAALKARRAQTLTQVRREAELIGPGAAEIIATALVQPSQDPADIAARDLEVERIAMQLAIATESAQGAEVRDVSNPERARLAGLTDYPGFDLLSKRPGEERGIEVKGRVGTDAVELTENEWAKACNLRERYWLYAVFDCGTPWPRLLRVQDPFQKLIARARGAVVFNYGDIARVAEAG